MDVWEYFQQRERECRESSLVPSDNFPTQYREKQGSGGQRGFVIGRYYLTDRALIEAMEIVEVVDGSHIHRLQYSYYLVVDGAEVYSRERDPSHNPAEHGHGRHHVRKDAGRISFVQFVTGCWEIVSDLPDEPIDDDFSPRG